MKEIIIPERPKDKDFLNSAPSFVRNVMGSSAGAGSGEFHVYRHLRRKEYARQKCIEEKSRQEVLDDEFQKKLDDNRRLQEEKTAKKRQKRLKKKKGRREKKPKPASVDDGQDSKSEEESSGNEQSDQEDQKSSENLLKDDSKEADSSLAGKLDEEKIVTPVPERNDTEEALVSVSVNPLLL